MLLYAIVVRIQDKLNRKSTKTHFILQSQSQLAALLSSGGTHFPFGEGSFALATVALRIAEAEVERLEGDSAPPCTGNEPETKLAQTMEIDTKSYLKKNMRRWIHNFMVSYGLIPHQPLQYPISSEDFQLHRVAWLQGLPGCHRHPSGLQRFRRLALLPCLIWSASAGLRVKRILHLSSSIIMYHHLSQSILIYYILLLSFIIYHQLLSSIMIYHWRSSSIII